MSETLAQPVVKTDLSNHLPLLATGKVREIYSIDANTLLFVATDRISAYDVVMANGIPNKGALLTLISEFWFRYLTSQIPHLRTHFVSLGLPETIASRIPPAEIETQQLQQRSCIVRKLNVLPVESIVRGYITGSAWESYKKTGMVNGEKLPEGLQESQRLDKPIWTPSTKAEQGAHDENISREQAVQHLSTHLASPALGATVASALESLSLQIYQTAATYATSRGIILADTKFEFALEASSTASSDPQLVLVDEVLTPDSSRFWRADDYEVGRGQKSLDKQYLRDWLTREKLKGKEGVEVPEEVVRGTMECYRQAFEMLTGRTA